MTPTLVVVVVVVVVVAVALLGVGFYLVFSVCFANLRYLGVYPICLTYHRPIHNTYHTTKTQPHAKHWIMKHYVLNTQIHVLNVLFIS